MLPQPLAPHRTAARLKALVADDTGEVRTLTALCLERLGLEAVTAGTGREALKLLNADHFDLVVTDIVMPDVDGIQLISEVRKQYPDTRILAITGDSHIIDRELCVRLATGLGAHGTLKKPFSQSQFTFAMRQVMPGCVPG